jgi:hypothetical protein
VQLKDEMDRIVAPRAIASIILSSEDRIRMTRLYEEVLTRLEEMAMITARTLKMHASAASTVKFNPILEHREFDFAAVEIISTNQGQGCYDYREGACFRTIAPESELEVQQ